MLKCVHYTFINVEHQRITFPEELHSILLRPRELELEGKVHGFGHDAR